MGIIAVVVILIVGLICYNIWFNLKYSEGEQIMMRHRKEKKREEKIKNEIDKQLREKFFPDNPFLEILNETLNERQKYALILMMSIINTDYFGKKQSKHNEYINELHKLLNISNQGFLDYSELIGVNNSIYKNHLKTFHDEQKIYLMVFVVEMLMQGGKPNSKDLEKTKNKIMSFLNITSDEYRSLVNKANQRINNYNNMLRNGD